MFTFVVFSCMIFAAIPASTFNVSVSLAAPSNASFVSPSYLSFSIEQDRWTDWAGLDTRNEFFYNALTNIEDIAGELPRLRVGADSADRTNFQSGLKETESVFESPTSTTPYPEADSDVVGEAFYRAARHLPPGTHVTWGVNLRELNATAAYLETKAIAAAFNSFPASSGLVLDAIEIGNEANDYVEDYFRSDNYSVAQYVSEWTTLAANVSAVVPINEDSTIKFWAGSFASANHSTSDWIPQQLFDNGLLTSSAGMQIDTYSQHLYNGVATSCGTISNCLQGLMTKDYIRGNLSAFTADIAVAKAYNLSYILGETNSYARHGAPGISNSAGAALWALDYVFFASQLGIDRLFFHEGVGYRYNFIQPVTLNISIIDGTLDEPLPPHVQPLYYAAIIIAEAIGKKGNVSVAEISLNSTTVSGYAFYTYEGEISKALFINSEGYFTNTTTERTSVHLDLDFVNGTNTGNAPSEMTVKRLEIGYADDTSGLTWGGQTYETSDARVSGNHSVERYDVSIGIDLLATQAVLVTFSN
ncbi:glycoside hydrolase family 79 protein [Lentinula novae-zelandiae]|nr:glycoside hydrolase family 79 protein [Lentinula novae-zelandiae]